MQSLKSTAFAVTLLAISFGLYCVSSNEKATEEEIDFGGPQIYEGVAQDSITPMTPNTEFISTNAAPGIAPTTPPAMGLPDLPPMSTMNSNQIASRSLSAPPLQTPSDNAPVNLRTEPPALNASFTTPDFSSGPSEISNRQPVSKSPAIRDEGLIDALKPELKPATQANGFTTQPINADVNANPSYNSLAGAVSKDGDRGSVRNAAETAPFKMPGNSPGPQAAPANDIKAAWKQVDDLVEKDDFRGALSLLSRFYRSKNITGPQQQRLQAFLDALAGKVVYSPEHHFTGQAYVVQQGETLETIAAKLKVPAEVIFNINQQQFAGANEVRPGMNLKVVSGPFHAEVSLDNKMMTLFIQDLYAGRFPVAVGVSGKPKEGTYAVMVKSAEGYAWRDESGKQYPPGSPENGYGPYWIGLTQHLCVHAVPNGTASGHRGCIGLSVKDAKDIYGMLSRDSKISIVR